MDGASASSRQRCARSRTVSAASDHHLGTLGVGIISYAGGLSIAVAADKVPSSVGVTERICARFEERFELYVQKAREVLDHLD